MKKVMKLFCCAAAAGFLSGSVLAADQLTFPDRQPFNGVFPVVDGAGTVTIAGEGIWYRTNYESGDRPYLSPYADDGKILPDGQYRFEYRSSTRSSENTGASLANTSDSRGESLRGQFRVSGAQIIFE